MVLNHNACHILVCIISINLNTDLAQLLKRGKLTSFGLFAELKMHFVIL